KFMCLLTAAHLAVDYGIIMGNGESGGWHGQTCLSMQNDPNEAVKCGLKILREAMSIGREHGIVNCFGWRPDVIPRLCVNALDAGIEVSYVRHLIRTRHLTPGIPPLGCENWPWPLKIVTLGRFAILRDEAPISFGGKVQHKPMELLKAIISFGGNEVPKDTLVDILWPNAEGDMARQSFDTTLYRLRRLIGNDKAIGLQGEQLSLDARYCWVDIRAFESLYKKAEDIFKAIGEMERGGKGEISDTTSFPDAPLHLCTPAQAEILSLSQKAIALYKGRFLPSDTRCLWTVSTRERLRNKFHNLCIMLGNYLEQAGQWQKVSEHYLRAIEIDDLAEEFYRRLMVCYQRLGQRAKAIEVYQRLKNTLSAAFQIGPSAGTNAVYRALFSEEDRT
ncbi:MAG: bacterial transcriptional activator domain-containing protein, partial [Thermodesulfobacteriota bacterium]